jgi:hypothetical protein
VPTVKISKGLFLQNNPGREVKTATGLGKPLDYNIKYIINNINSPVPEMLHVPAMFRS